jgi:hypothetical protein
MKHNSIDAVLFKLESTRPAMTIAKSGYPCNLSNTCFLGCRRNHRKVVEIDMYLLQAFFPFEYSISREI